MEIFYSAAYYDISDYIVSCSDVPVVSRNRSFGINSKGFKMSVSENYNNTRLAGATIVRVWIDSTVKFFGYPTKITKNYDKHTYDFEVEEMLGKLRNYYVDTETLNAVIIDTNQDLNYRGDDGGSTTTDDNLGWKNVAMLWLIQKMFEVAGLSMTINLYGAGVSVVDDKWVFMTGTSHDPAVQDDFYFEDVRLDLNMLYSINQSYANTAAKITSDDEGDYSYAKNKVTFFDLFNALCLIFSMDIYYGGTEYFILRYGTGDDESYATTDDDTYSKTVGEVEKRDDSVHWVLGAAQRADYQDATADTLTSFFKSGDKAGTTLDWYASLIFLIQGKWAAATDGDVYLYQTSDFGAGWNMFTPLDGIVGNRMEIEVGSAYTKTNIISPVEASFNHVHKNLLSGNPHKTQKSKITEISY